MPKQRQKSYKRHDYTVGVAKILLSPLFKWLFKLRINVPPNLQGPHLIYANHNTDLDAVLIQMGFRESLHFVASEHIFRVGFVSKLLVYFLNPIPRLKGSADMGTVREILRRLKDGKNVCIFAEGNRSFNGLTGPIPPSTGKLAKSCKVPLITYKFEGGYFTTPRWSYTMRRGQMHGSIVNIYSVEQLQKMSVDEINATINTDLFEDAYARQNKEQTPFKGKRLAEGLETALYICPKCEQIGTLTSQNNRFFCTCGLNAKYDELGYLNDVSFKTVTEWDSWQSEKLTQIANDLGDETVFTDESVDLRIVLKNHQTQQVQPKASTLAMYRDKIVCGNTTFPLQEISDMAIYGRGNIAFTSHGKNYTLTAGKSFCGRKYLQLYQQLQTAR